MTLYALDSLLSPAISLPESEVRRCADGEVDSSMACSLASRARSDRSINVSTVMRADGKQTEVYTEDDPSFANLRHAAGKLSTWRIDASQAAALVMP